uniref:Autophagy-related protein 101 n=1 Tax=Triticum urartu TaxID=4572 RepID=A0A8R7TNK2_TRIUA
GERLAFALRAEERRRQEPASCLSRSRISGLLSRLWGFPARRTRGERIESAPPPPPPRRSAAMNCETCHLNELELEPLEIKDVLRCILHTIFFHRTLTLVRPKDVDCDLFEITYVSITE